MPVGTLTDRMVRGARTRAGSDDLLHSCPTLQEILELLLKIPIDRLLPGKLVPVARDIKVLDSDVSFS